MCPRTIYSCAHITYLQGEEHLLFLSGTGDDVVDAQDEAGGLHRCLQSLCLHTVGFPNAELVHVGGLAGDAVHAPRGAVLLREMRWVDRDRGKLSGS